MQRNFLLLLGILFLLEFYVYQAFKTLFHQSWQRIGYWIVTILIYAVIVIMLMTLNRGERDHHKLQFTITLFLVAVLPKIIAAVFLLIEDFTRLIGYAFSYFGNNGTHFPARRKFLSIIALGSAGVLSMLFLDGVIFGKYRFKARKVKLKIKNLPEAFKGYRIVQISDVHSGSFFHPEKLQKAINLINKQNADIVLFTGDMVNSLAEEFEPFVPLFKTIQSKDGKFAVLGNHDYGIYSLKTQQEQDQNVLDLIELEKQAGFEMLRNEHRIIEKNGQKLYIIGVENWGEKPFPQYGDLDKAAKGIPPEAAKILMSHDPTYFDHYIKMHPCNVQLTLSGHTHGMQFGLDLKNVKWSPVEYRYPKWIDLYESNGKYLYVNRGFGVVAYPGRVGVDPEITVFELS